MSISLRMPGATLKPCKGCREDFEPHVALNGREVLYCEDCTQGHRSAGAKAGRKVGDEVYRFMTTPGNGSLCYGSGQLRVFSGTKTVEGKDLIAAIRELTS